MTPEFIYLMEITLGGILAGGSTAMLGVHIVGMRIPFLGVCISHAALAGAVFGSLLGLTGATLIWPSLAGAVITALALGTTDPHQGRVDTNIVMGVLLSLTMGLALLGLGLFSRLGRSDAEALSLLWGSLALIGRGDLLAMAIIAAVQGAFFLLLFKEMRAILFSRLHAAAVGIHHTLVWTAFLMLACVVVTINFRIVGGLMLYSLMVNPAAAAFQLAQGYTKTLFLTIFLGALCGASGFLISCFIPGVPTGAAIVIVSSLLVLAAAIVKRLLLTFEW